MRRIHKLEYMQKGMKHPRVVEGNIAVPASNARNRVL